MKLLLLIFLGALTAIAYVVGFVNNAGCDCPEQPDYVWVEIVDGRTIKLPTTPEAVVISEIRMEGLRQTYKKEQDAFLLHSIRASDQGEDAGDYPEPPAFGIYRGPGDTVDPKARAEALQAQIATRE